MIDMPTIESIRDMSRQGLTNAEIQRRTGVSQPTIRKYLAMDDFSPQMPAKSRRGSILDPYKPFIDSILEGDLHVWRKQRHSAQRIYERLLDETPYAGGYGIVKKCVRERKAQMKASETAFIELVWAPGEAQADFGDVDVVCRGERVRMHFFALSFPFSNMGFCQLFAGETPECACQGLKDVFEHVGGVPHRIVFDNATGAGRKISGKVTEAELFSRMHAHYGFSVTCANPDSGHEKGNVERKVGWPRQHLFTPMPALDDIAAFNAALLGRCDGYAGNEHYEKHMSWGELFERDRAALLPLPAKPFACVRYGSAIVDKRGCASVDGGHRYHVSDAMAGRPVTVAYGAHGIAFANSAGEVLAEHDRRFGTAAGSPDPASQLGLLARRPGAWRNSPARAALPANVAAHMDSMESAALSDLVKCMKKWCASWSYDEVASALSEVLARTGATRAADVEMMLARIGGLGLGPAPDVGPDLSAYDGLLGCGAA